MTPLPRVAVVVSIGEGWVLEAEVPAFAGMTGVMTICFPAHHRFELQSGPEREILGGPSVPIALKQETKHAQFL
jgi:hypothetical protein